MRLIGLAVVLILSLALVPLAAEGQEAGKVSRIGLLGYSAGWEPFRQALRDLGYAEGRNIAIEYRLTEGGQERLHEHAAELVRLKVDVLVTAGTPNTQAAMRATTTIPIVVALAGDIQLMPGLGKEPAYTRIDIDRSGQISGLT